MVQDTQPSPCDAVAASKGEARVVAGTWWLPLNQRRPEHHLCVSSHLGFLQQAVLLHRGLWRGIPNLVFLPKPSSTTGGDG